jgi:type IV pilus assembly protein PilM
MLSLGRRNPKRDEIIAIDLGSRVTKAVLLRGRGPGVALVNHAVLELEEAERVPSREVLAEHLRKVVRQLGAGTRRVAVSLSPAKTLLTNLDLPGASPSDLRRMIRLSPKNYLQRDVTDHLFDCHVTGGKKGDTDHTTRIRRKAKVLVGGARQSDVDEVSVAARDAGLTVERVTLSQVAIANAFQARPEDRGEVVALLDIGYASTSINIMMAGDLVFTRVINFGAERFSDVVTQSAKLRQPEGWEGDGPSPDEMQTRLQRAILLLAREVDASIGFFVSQHESTISRILVSGGSARSQFILQTLEAELGLPCESWGPADSVKLQMAEDRRQELEYEAPQLLVAVGSGLGALISGLVSINLLADEQEVQEWRRRDPVRRGFWSAGFAVGLMVMWGAWEGYQLWRAGKELEQLQTRLKSIQANPGESLNNAQRIQEMEKRIRALDRHGRDRMLWAAVLDALQFTTVEDIEFFRLSINLMVTKPGAKPPPPAATSSGTAIGNPGKPAVKSPPPPQATQRMVLVIQGKNYGDPKQIGRFIEEIVKYPYFKKRLRLDDPALLKDLQPRQVDPGNPNRSFALFTIECYGAEEPLSHE